MFYCWYYSETMVEHSKKYCARIMRLPGTMDKSFVQGNEKGKGSSTSNKQEIDLSKAEFMTFNGWQQSASGDPPVSCWLIYTLSYSCFNTLYTTPSPVGYYTFSATALLLTLQRPLSTTSLYHHHLYNIISYNTL